MRKIVLALLAWISLWDLVWGLSYREILQAYNESYRYEREGRLAKAIESLLPVYKTHPKDYTVNLRLGWLFYRAGRYGEAIKHYQKALSARPEAVEPLLGLSLPYLAQKNWTQVENLMYQVLKIDYYNYYGNLRLALALRNQRKYAQAENICRKMLALYPSDINFLAEWALNLYYTGKREQARKAFKYLSILAPQSPLPKKYFPDLR